MGALRRADLPGHAGDRHADVHRDARAGRGDRRLVGDRRTRCGHRARDRRLAARALQLALGVLGQRAARRRHDRARPSAGCPSRATRRSAGSTSSGCCSRSPASSALVWSVIEGPSNGWTSPIELGGFAAAAALLAAFVAWESRHSHPVLSIALFANRRFSAGAGAISVAFFGLFGFIFVVTQYFQVVRGLRHARRRPAHAAVRDRHRRRGPAGGAGGGPRRQHDRRVAVAWC